MFTIYSKSTANISSNGSHLLMARVLVYFFIYFFNFFMSRLFVNNYSIDQGDRCGNTSVRLHCGTGIQCKTPILCPRLNSFD